MKQKPKGENFVSWVPKSYFIFSLYGAGQLSFQGVPQWYSKLVSSYALFWSCSYRECLPWKGKHSWSIWLSCSSTISNSAVYLFDQQYLRLGNTHGWRWATILIPLVCIWSVGNLTLNGFTLTLTFISKLVLIWYF